MFCVLGFAASTSYGTLGFTAGASTGYVYPEVNLLLYGHAPMPKNLLAYGERPSACNVSYAFALAYAAEQTLVGSYKELIQDHPELFDAYFQDLVPRVSGAFVAVAQNVQKQSVCNYVDPRDAVSNLARRGIPLQPESFLPWPEDTTTISDLFTRGTVGTAATALFPWTRLQSVGGIDAANDLTNYTPVLRIRSADELQWLLSRGVAVLGVFPLSFASEDNSEETAGLPQVNYDVDNTSTSYYAVNIIGYNQTNQQFFGFAAMDKAFYVTGTYSALNFTDGGWNTFALLPAGTTGLDSTQFTLIRYLSPQELINLGTRQMKMTDNGPQEMATGEACASMLMENFLCVDKCVMGTPHQIQAPPSMTYCHAACSISMTMQQMYSQYAIPRLYLAVTADGLVCQAECNSLNTINGVCTTRLQSASVAALGEDQYKIHDAMWYFTGGEEKSGALSDQYPFLESDVLHKRCRFGAYKLSGSTKKCVFMEQTATQNLISEIGLQHLVIDTCPSGYFYEDPEGILRCILECKAPAFSYIILGANKKCVTSCADGIKQSDESLPLQICIQQCSSDTPFFGPQGCASSCESGTIKSLTNNLLTIYQCVKSCDGIFFIDTEHQGYTNCVEKCPSGLKYIETTGGSKQCVANCSGTNIFVVNDQAGLLCTSICPSNLYRVLDGANLCVTGCNSGEVYDIKSTSDIYRVCSTNCTAPNVFLDGDTNLQCSENCSSGRFENTTSGSLMCRKSCFIYQKYLATNMSACVQSCPDSAKYLKDSYCQSSCSDFVNRTAITDPTGLQINVLLCQPNCSYFRYENDDVTKPKICYSRCDESGANYILKGDKTSQCMLACPASYPLIETNSQCVSACQSKTYLQLMQELRCIESCQQYVVVDGAISGHKLCVQECPKTHLLVSDNNECVNRCPSELFFLDSGSGILFCSKECPADLAFKLHASEFNFQLRCVSACPEGYTKSEDGVCVASCTVGYVAEDGQTCISQCPSAWVQDGAVKRCVSSCPGVYELETATDSFLPGQVKHCMTSCKDLPYQIGNECMRTCSGYEYKSSPSSQAVCVSICDGFAFTGGDGKKQCGSTCAAVGAYLDGFACKSSCQSTIFETESSGERLCVANCAGFRNSAGSLTECVPSCPSGFWEESGTGSRLCVSSCSGSVYQTSSSGTAGKQCISEETCAGFLVQVNTDPVLKECVPMCPAAQRFIMETVSGGKTLRSCASRCVGGLFQKSAGDYYVCVETCSGGSGGTGETVKYGPDETQSLCLGSCADNGLANGEEPKECKNACADPRYFLAENKTICMDACDTSYYDDQNTCQSACGGFVVQTAEGPSKCVSECPAEARFHEITAEKTLCVAGCASHYFTADAAGALVCQEAGCANYWIGVYNEVLKVKEFRCVETCDLNTATKHSYRAGKECLELESCAFYNIGAGNELLCVSACDVAWKDDPVGGGGKLCISECAAPNQYVEENRSCSASCTSSLFENKTVGTGGAYARVCVRECSNGAGYSNFIAAGIWECKPSCGTGLNQLSMTRGDGKAFTICVPSCGGTAPFLNVTTLSGPLCSASCTSKLYQKRAYLNMPGSSAQLCVDACGEMLVNRSLNYECVSSCYAQNKMRFYVNETGSSLCTSSRPSGMSFVIQMTNGEEQYVSSCGSKIFEEISNEKFCRTQCIDLWMDVSAIEAGADKQYQCVYSCPSAAIYIEQAKFVTDAPSGLLTSKKCVATCQSKSFEKVENNDQSEDNVCVDSCPNFFKAFDGQSLCLNLCATGDVIYNRECFSECPALPALYLDGSLCVESCDSRRFERVSSSSDPVKTVLKCTASCPWYWKAAGDHQECVAACDGFLSDTECVSACARYYTEKSKLRICVQEKEAPSDYWVETTVAQADSTSATVLLSECPADAPYESGGKCVAACPGSMFQEDAYRAQRKTCVESCSMYKIALGSAVQCVRECPNGYKQAGLWCVLTCGDSFPFVDGAQCVATCPQKFFSQGPGGAQECERDCAMYSYREWNAEHKMHRCTLSCSGFIQTDPNETRPLCIGACATKYYYFAGPGDTGDKVCAEKCPPEKPYLVNESATTFRCVSECSGKLPFVTLRDDASQECTETCASGAASEARVCQGAMPSAVAGTIAKAARANTAHLHRTPSGKEMMIQGACDPSLERVSYENRCVSQCPDSTYLLLDSVEKVCDACSSGVFLPLTLGEWQCLPACPESHPFQDGFTCFAVCRSGFWEEENGVKRCVKSCGRFVDEKTRRCVPDCSGRVVGNVCTAGTKCPEEYKFERDTGVGIECVHSCVVFYPGTTPLRCVDQCEEGHVAYLLDADNVSIQCLGKCPAGFKETGGKCQLPGNKTPVVAASTGIALVFLLLNCALAVVICVQRASRNNTLMKSIGFSRTAASVPPTSRRGHLATQKKSNAAVEMTVQRQEVQQPKHEEKQSSLRSSAKPPAQTRSAFLRQPGHF